MNTDQQIEIRLWNYIDGDLGVEERKDIEQLLQHNETWQTVYKELLHMHQLINNNLELEEPSMRFTKKVMEEISKTKIAPASKNYINKRIITGIAVFFIFLIVALLLYVFIQVDWATGGTTIPTIDLTKFELSKYFNNQFLDIFEMLIVVFGLILLDKVLLQRRNTLKHRLS